MPAKRTSYNLLITTNLRQRTQTYFNAKQICNTVKMEYETKCNIYFICEGSASKNFALLVLQVIDLLQLKIKMPERVHYVALLKHNS